MKTAMSIKAVAYLVLGIFALVKSRDLAKKKYIQLPAVEILGEAEGKVVDVLRDDYGWLIEVSHNNQTKYLIVDGTPPDKGENIRYQVSRSLEAYESKTIGLAYQSIQIVKGFEVI